MLFREPGRTAQEVLLSNYIQYGNEFEYECLKKMIKIVFGFNKDLISISLFLPIKSPEYILVEV